MSKPSMKVQVSRAADKDTLGFTGDLTDDFSACVAHLPRDMKNHVVIDLGGVKTVNSYGIREWLSFIKSLGTRQLTFEKCSPTFVMSANVVINLFGKGKVASVYLGYECHNRHYWWKLIETAKLDVAGLRKEKEVCTSCGLPGKPEESPADYFQFFENMRAS